MSSIPKGRRDIFRIILFICLAQACRAYNNTNPDQERIYEGDLRGPNGLHLFCLRRELHFDGALRVFELSRREEEVLGVGHYFRTAPWDRPMAGDGHFRVGGQSDLPSIPDLLDDGSVPVSD